MNKNITKFLMLVSTMGLSKRELKDLFRDLSQMDVGDIVDLCSSIEEFSEHVASYGFDEVHVPEVTLYSAETDVGVRVERLLRHEAGLGTQEAVSLISDAIVKRGVLRPRDIPPLSKKSLADWVARLSHLVDAKILLNIATVIRNEFAHVEVSNWLSKGRL